MGKTTAHLAPLMDAAHERASSGHHDGVERFAALTFRSRLQAQEKAREFRARGYSAIAIEPFWEHYRQACAAVGETELAQSEFDESQPSPVLQRISEEQRSVYESLVTVRQKLWRQPGPRPDSAESNSRGDGLAWFDGGTTLLTMTHKAAAETARRGPVRTIGPLNWERTIGDERRPRLSVSSEGSGTALESNVASVARTVRRTVALSRTRARRIGIVPLDRCLRKTPAKGPRNACGVP
jgi:hypothetical protein